MRSLNGSIHTTQTPPPLSFYNTFKDVDKYANLAWVAVNWAKPSGSLASNLFSLVTLNTKKQIRFGSENIQEIKVEVHIQVHKHEEFGSSIFNNQAYL
jgi:hypothetical protein